MTITLTTTSLYHAQDAFEGGNGYRVELETEKALLEKGVDFVEQKMKSVDNYLKEMRQVGSIEEWERVSMVGIKASKAIYL